VSINPDEEVMGCAVALVSHVGENNQLTEIGRTEVRPPGASPRWESRCVSHAPYIQAHLARLSHLANTFKTTCSCFSRVQVSVTPNVPECSAKLGVMRDHTTSLYVFATIKYHQ
jgi:hypothetical protein